MTAKKEISDDKLYWKNPIGIYLFSQRTNNHNAWILCSFYSLYYCKNESYPKMTTGSHLKNGFNLFTYFII